MVKLTKKQKKTVIAGGILAGVGVAGGLIYYYREPIQKWFCENTGMFCEEPLKKCTIEGDTKCVGYNLYKCINGEWVLQQTNSSICGYAPPECIENNTKCVGNDLYKCVNSKWGLYQANSSTCNLCKNVICADVCVGYDLYTQKCQPSTGACVVDTIKQNNSSVCGYVQTSRVYGTVTESTTSYNPSAEVPNAEVILTNRETDAEYTTYTDSVGGFEVVVPYGYYDCVISKNGFFMYTNILNLNVAQANFNLGYHTSGIMVMRMPTLIELKYPAAANFWGSSCCWTSLGKHQELYVTAIISDQKGYPMEDVEVQFLVTNTTADINNGGFQSSDGKIWWAVDGLTNSSGSIRTRYWARSEAGEVRGFDVIALSWCVDGVHYFLDYPWISSYGQITISAGGGAGRYTCYGKCEKTFTLIATGVLDKGGI